jgi:hypothetical protein
MPTPPVPKSAMDDPAGGLSLFSTGAGLDAAPEWAEQMYRRSWVDLHDRPLGHVRDGREGRLPEEVRRDRVLVTIAEC